MSKKGLTEIACVLDRSGSMGSVIDDAIGGFNTFLKSQQECKDGEARISIAMFDDHYDMICESKDIHTVDPFTLKTYVPRGMTALNDAIGKTITHMGEMFDKRPDSGKPEKVIFVILTDGQENSSNEYHIDRVRELIKQQKEQWKWEFIFLSSDLSAIQQGSNLGINNTVQYAATGVGTRNAYQTVNNSVLLCRATGDVGDLPQNI